MKSNAVVDSTCLIVLERIARLSLLSELYSPVVIPPEVALEFGRILDWMEVRRPTDLEMFQALSTRLARVNPPQLLSPWRLLRLRLFSMTLTRDVTLKNWDSP